MRLNNNDYIDSRQFTKEECEKFCELAVSQEYELGKVMLYYGKSSLPFLAIHWNKPYWSVEPRSYWNNVTEQFREHLNWQPNSNPKSLLKDGMRVMLRSGATNHVINGCLWEGDNTDKRNRFGIRKNYQDDLKHGRTDKLGGNPDDIMKIVDRDGTIVWERKEQPEPKEMTVAEIEKALGHSIKVVK